MRHEVSAELELPQGETPQPVMEAVVRGMHRRSSQAPITYANEHGAFGHADHQTVFPMVIDANVLRDEVLRTLRTGQRTILCNAANIGVLRLFCAEHVVEEVCEHLKEWARDKSLDTDEAWRVWESDYLPLLRLVDVPDGLTTAAESARLSVLADPDPPHGDPDDVPSATLAILLGAPLLSKDGNPLRAVYGPDFDRHAHTQWLRALAAGGDLGPLGQYMQMASMVTLAVGYGGYSAIRGVVRRVPWPWLAAGVATLGLGAAYARPKPGELVPARARRVMVGALELFGEIVTLHSAAQRQFETLAAPRPSWDEVAKEPGGSRALTRHCLFELARTPDSDQSAEELVERLRFDAAVAHGEAKVRAVLRAERCFEEVYRGRFQVGMALARSAIEDVGTA